MSLMTTSDMQAAYFGSLRCEISHECVWTQGELERRLEALELPQCNDAVPRHQPKDQSD